MKRIIVVEFDWKANELLNDGKSLLVSVTTLHNPLALGANPKHFYHFIIEEEEDV